MVVGIAVGSGIFRTPGLVAAQLGRPGLTFVAWVLGGAVSLLGALVFAELATRHPQAGGKYVYAREAYGRRAGFVVGWVEGLVLYSSAIAAVATVSGEYLARLLAWRSTSARGLGVVLIVLFTGLNLLGVTAGRLVQNLTTGAKVLALALVVVVAGFAGGGAGWHTSLAGAPTGLATWGALAVAFQAVIWTYYGYPDAAKIAEEIDDPDRRLPRIFLFGILGVTALYVLLNAAFLQVLPLERIASSTLVAGDVTAEIFGARAGALMAGLALLVVLASLNGNIFVTPRVVFGLARDGLGPVVLARVNAGGTPWTAMILVGVVSAALAASGTFERLLSLAITLVLALDGFMVFVLFRLRRREGRPAFQVPFYPVLPLAFLLTYAALFLGAAVQQPVVTVVALCVLGAAWGLSVRVVR
jgi:APA family basic amino acid/polyamine antiporter